MASKEKQEAVTLTLTAGEREDLKVIAINTLGSSNMTGLVRFWINKAKNEGVIKKE